MRRASALAAPALLLAGPTVLAFASGGYFTGPRLVAIIVALVALALAVLGRSEGRPAPAATPDGAAGGGRRRSSVASAPTRAAVAGLAGLAVWTAVSAAWAPLEAPAIDSRERTLLYLIVLVASVLTFGRRRIAAWVEPALAAGTVVVLGYAVLGHAGLIPISETRSAGGRLDQPLTYWNAEGALAAIGLVLCVRLAGSRTRPLAMRVAAAGAAPLLGLATYLTFSRGALTSLAVGLAVLLAFSPTWSQVRAVAIALEGAVLAVVAFELLPDGVALVPLLALMLLGAAAQAWSAQAESDAARIGPVPGSGRVRTAAWVAAALLALAPFAASVLAGDQAPQNPAFGATAERLGSAGSNRYAYWDVAVQTFAEEPAIGVGAGGFAASWLEKREIDETVRDAHSLPLETAAELGLVGLALLVLLFGGVVAAIVAAGRADPALAAGPTAALAAWAAHAAIDWDWEMPAVTLVAAVLAGSILARGYHRAPS